MLLSCEWPSETVGFPGPLIPGQVSESDPIIIKLESNTKWNLTLSTDNEKAVLSAYDTVARRYITNGDYINDTPAIQGKRSWSGKNWRGLPSHCTEHEHR